MMINNINNINNNKKIPNAYGPVGFKRLFSIRVLATSVTCTPIWCAGLAIRGPTDTGGKGRRCALCLLPAADAPLRTQQG